LRLAVDRIAIDKRTVERHLSASAQLMKHGFDVRLVRHVSGLLGLSQRV
jgi:hypothetical protein